MPKAIAMNEVGQGCGAAGTPWVRPRHSLDRRSPCPCHVRGRETLAHRAALSYTLACAQLVWVTASDDGDGISTLPSPSPSPGKFNDRNDLEPKVTA